MTTDNNNFNLDDILSEFTEDEAHPAQSAFSAAQDEKSAQDEREDATEQSAEDISAEKEEFTPEFMPSGKAYRRPAAWAVSGSRPGNTPQPDPDKYLDYNEKRRAAAIQKKEEAVLAREDAQKSALRRKDRDAVARSARIREERERAETPVKSALCAVLSVLAVVVLCWLALCVHPGSGGSGTGMKNNLNLTSKLDVYANNAKSDALGDLAYIKKIYTIAESDTVAPAPNPKGFGTTQDPAVIKAVIADAAELLDGQETVWQPDLPFYPNSQMYYYSDPTILVIVWKEIVEERCATLAEIKVADGSQLRRKLAEDSYGSQVYMNATTLASAANAVVASNADCYGYRQLGLTVYQRQLFRNNADKLDTCFVTAGGDLLFSRAGELTGDAAVERYIADNDVLFSLSFGPVLIDNGVLQQCESYPIGEVQQEYSRAGIGMTGDLHYLLMTVNHTDGRPRATVNEFAQFMYSKGCVKAYNLDGGQTSEITILGEPVNYIDFGAERAVSDIIYFATALPETEVRK